MTNPTKKNDGKVRDINIRLAFMKRNLKFFEQDGMEFCNEYGINSTNVVDLAGFDFNKNIFYGFEINYDSLILSKINLFLRTVDAQLFQTDVLTNELGKFDFVFSAVADKLLEKQVARKVKFVQLQD